MEEPRRQLHGWVTPEALTAWRRFARAHDTNVTALLEAIAKQLALSEERSTLPPVLRDAVRDAQRIAGSRSIRTRSVD